MGFTKFTIENGLPSNTIYDIETDEHGFLWIATDYGISKFDGSTFKNFTIKEGLIGNEILHLFKDSQNRIWLAGFNGKIGFIKNDKFYNEINSTYLKKLNFGSFVKDIFEDSKGNIIFCQKKLVKILYPNNSTKEIHISSNSKSYAVLSLENKKNEVVLITYKKLDKPKLITKKISDPTGSWMKFNPKEYDYKAIQKIKNNFGLQLKLYNDTIQSISKNYLKTWNNYLAKIYDYKNSILITNLNNGIHIFNKNEFTLKPKVYLPNTRTTRAFIDGEQNIWIGTHSNGLYYFPNLFVTGVKFSNNKKNNFYSIQHFKNEIIAGNENNEIIIFDTKTLQEKKTFKTNTNPERIRKIKKHQNKLFVLSENYIHVLDNLYNFKKIKSFYQLDSTVVNLVNFKDLSFYNKSIISANSNGVSKINLEKNSVKKIWNSRSTAIYQKSKDSIFIGTTKGLYLYSKNEVKKFDLGYLFNNSIIYALEDSPFGLLIGSNSFGLGILNGKNFKSISTSQGLLSNYIKSIYVCESNNIWLSTNLGLNKLELTQNNNVKSIKSYTISEGLFSNDVRDCVVIGSKVYVATSNGINVIDITKENDSHLKPKIYLNKILVNNRIINKNKPKTFDYTHNNFEFDYSGISFKSLGNLSFKYRLKGIDKDWVNTKNNSVRYAGLPAGNYTFEAVSIAKNNIQSKNIISYNFKITPPFYNTWWFAVLILGILFLALYLYFNQRNVRLQKDTKLNESLSNLKYKALNSQMSPHFISNLMVNINSLMNKGEYNIVESSLQHFGFLVKTVLKSTKSNLIKLNEELDMTRSYLELQKLRFTSLKFTIDTSTLTKDDLIYTLVPPMIIQPIVENSLKHGFNNRKDNCNILINIFIENENYLICEICDNGKGIIENTTEAESRGISLQNIQERLELLSLSAKKEQFIFTENIYNDFRNLVGLKVTIKIPL